MMETMIQTSSLPESIKPATLKPGSSFRVVKMIASPKSVVQEITEQQRQQEQRTFIETGCEETKTTNVGSSSNIFSSTKYTNVHNHLEETEMEHQLASETLTRLLMTIDEKEILEQLMFRLQSTRRRQYKDQGREIERQQRKLAKLTQFLPEGMPTPIVEVEVVQIEMLSKQVLAVITDDNERNYRICSQIVLLLGQTLPTRDLIALLCEVMRGLGRKGSHTESVMNRGGGCEMMIEVLSRHRRNRYVVEAIESAIWHQSMNPVNIRRFLDCGAKELLINVMALHCDDVMIIREGLGALANLLSTSSGSNGNGKSFHDIYTDDSDNGNSGRYHRLDRAHCQTVLTLWWRHYRTDPNITENVSLLLVNLCAYQSEMQALIGCQSQITVSAVDWVQDSSECRYTNTPTVSQSSTDFITITGCDLILRMLHYYHSQQDSLMVAAICEVIQTLISDCDENESYFAKYGKCRELLMDLLKEYSHHLNVGNVSIRNKKMEAVKAICSTLMSFDLSFGTTPIKKSSSGSGKSSTISSDSIENTESSKKRRSNFDHRKLITLLVRIIRDQLKPFASSQSSKHHSKKTGLMDADSIPPPPPPVSPPQSPSFASFTRRLTGSLFMPLMGIVDNNAVLSTVLSESDTQDKSQSKDFDDNDEDDDDGEENDMNGTKRKVDAPLLSKVIALLANVIATATIACAPSSSSSSDSVHLTSTEKMAKKVLKHFTDDQSGCELMLQLLRHVISTGVDIFDLSSSNLSESDSGRTSETLTENVDNIVDAGCRILWSIACSSDRARDNLLQIPSTVNFPTLSDIPSESVGSECCEVITQLLTQYLIKEASASSSYTYSHSSYSYSNTTNTQPNRYVHHLLLLDLIATLRSLVSLDMKGKILCGQAGTCQALIEAMINFGGRMNNNTQIEDKSKEILGEVLSLISVLSVSIDNQDIFGMSGLCPILVEILRLHYHHQYIKKQEQESVSIYKHVMTIEEKEDYEQEETIIRRCCTIISIFANHEDCRLRLLDANACEVLHQVIGNNASYIGDNPPSIALLEITTEGNKKPISGTHAKATLALNRLQRQVSASSHASTVTTSSSGSGLILDSVEEGSGNSSPSTASTGSTPLSSPTVSSKALRKSHSLAIRSKDHSLSLETGSTNVTIGCSCM